jgi:hypothetical protein
MNKLFVIPKEKNTRGEKRRKAWRIAEKEESRPMFFLRVPLRISRLFSAGSFPLTTSEVSHEC